MYSTLFVENRALKKQLEDYHSQHNTLERRVKGLKRDVKSLKDELKDLDKYVNRETV
ncbi:6248_t:CDS:1, partial [Funneliformis geosporum]